MQIMLYKNSDEQILLDALAERTNRGENVIFSHVLMLQGIRLN